ncbi:MAG: Na+/H+ antiporter NhaA [Crocinitomicaceae bacterium]
MKQSPIDKLVIKPVSKLIHSSFASGIILFAAVAVALILANSSISEDFFHFWENKFSIGLADWTVSKSLHHWINDGLMAVFFFVIGLELKREIMNGELSNPKNAILPIGAGIGGMLFPALIYLLFNHDGNATDGWGIPMATDIAFALGILHFLGKKVPLTLKVFLTVLAIADDLGAVLVIAFFYTSEISMSSLGIASIFLSIMFLGNILGVRSLWFYSVVGLGGFWLSFSMSGVHATISGVLAAFAIPGDVKINKLAFVKRLKDLVGDFEKAKADDKSTLVTNEQISIIQKMKFYANASLTPLQQLENILHPIVAFVIMPIFALANAGITFDGHILEELNSPVTYGIILGLVIGKFIGVTGVVRVLTWFNWCKLPEGVSWSQIVGIGFIAGIGFTMSLFINNLAFSDPLLISRAKTGILFASIISGVIGFIILYRSGKPTRAR